MMQELNVVFERRSSTKLAVILLGGFAEKCNRLKARVVIYAYNHHVRLLSPEPIQAATAAVAQWTFKSSC
jgi:hypothetical protein